MKEVLSEDVLSTTDTAVELTQADQIADLDTLDLLDCLAAKGFEAPAQTLVRRASEDWVSFDELRREEWDVMKLSPAEFEELKQTFPDLRRQLGGILDEMQVASAWLERRKADKQFYRFLTGQAFQKSLTSRTKRTDTLLDSNQAVEGVKRQQRQAVRLQDDETARQLATIALETAAKNPEAAMFAVELVGLVKHAVLVSEQPRLTLVARRVAEDLGISCLEARGLIRSLCDSGDIGSRTDAKGTRFIVV